jgi:UDP-N-acetylmuramoyl-tripeptide--D-alanyl-D-alanine ligase
MLELGDASERFHRELLRSLESAKVDRVFLVGDAVAALHQALPERMRGGMWPSADGAIPALRHFLEPGDVVTVKGSRATRVSKIVEYLHSQSARPAN